jgi:hypothetical protein
MSRLLCLTLLFGFSSACTKHEVDVKPVEIKPIHITIDVNVKVEKDLEDFFKEIDEAALGENNSESNKSEEIQ